MDKATLEKIKLLQANAEHVRTGGKGTMRRKKKVVQKTPAADDKKLTNMLKKFSANPIPGIEEVNMIKEDGTVLHFTNPKVEACVSANTFSVKGTGEEKKVTDMLPGILSQLGSESLGLLKNLASKPISAFDNIDDDVPDLVGDFDEPSKCEEMLAGSCDGHGHTHEGDEKENKPKKKKKASAAKKKKPVETSA